MTNEATAEQSIDIRAIFGIARRRILYFLVPTLLVFAAVCAVAYSLPARYRATAIILVESQQIPSDLARSTVTSDANERLAVISQRLMTRSNLLQIVREYNLFPGGTDGMSSSEIVDLMRESTLIEQVGTDTVRRRDEQTIAFTVSFDYGDPANASAVANRFVELILEQNIRSRTGRASETYRFFQQQVKNLEADIAAHEQTIVAFKTDHETALPESLASRQTLLTELQSRIPELDRQIQTLKAEQEFLTTAVEQPTIGETLDPTGAELERLRLELAQLLAVYSERHPAVLRVKGRIEALEARPAPVTGENDAVSDASATRSADVVRRLRSVELQLGAVEVQRERELSRITELEETLNATPQVEVALNALNREYQALTERLVQARSSMAQAAVGEQLEEDRQAERFEVIEQATPPTEAATPNRRRIVLAGLFVSMAVGIGMVILLELLDQSIRAPADLERRLHMRALTTIPLVLTRRERRARIRNRTLGVASLASAVAAAAALVHVHYLPLDLVLDKVLKLVGI